MSDKNHSLTFTITFLAIYLVVLLTGAYILKIDLGASWIQLGSRAIVAKVLIFGIAPFISMVIGGMAGAIAGLKDRAEGTLNPSKFFGSFYLAFGIAYYIILRLGMYLIVGGVLATQWLDSFGLKGLAISGGLAPLLALAGSVKVVTAKARMS